LIAEEIAHWSGEAAADEASAKTSAAVQMSAGAGQAAAGWTVV
jgi:hypothetical protein